MIDKFASMAHKSIKTSTIIPNYYPEFACKGSQCRNTCCSGWAVTLSRQQYFDLIGIDCHKKLREKLDRTFHLVEYPSIERYAEIKHDPEGRCPLHRSDGYCMLHKDLGESALPSVCRTYPRGPRTDYAFELSCANSCEKTLEQLIGNDDKIVFTMIDYDFISASTSRLISPEDKLNYVKVRTDIFTMLSNRSFPLSSRILKVGNYLSDLDGKNNVDPEPDIGLAAQRKNNFAAIELMIKLSRDMKELFPRLSPYCDEFMNYYQKGDWQNRYDAALIHFQEMLPNQEIMLEKILINHLFFSQFPFQDRSLKSQDHFLSLSGTFLFIRHLSITWMLNHNQIDDFVDIMANMFRIISHSKFTNYVGSFLKNETAFAAGILVERVQS